MNLVEFFNYKMFPPAKKRTKKYWVGWDIVNKHPELKEGIEECLRTGKEQIVHDQSHLRIWVVKPEWPSLALTDEDGAKEGLLKVTVNMFTEAFTLGVEGTVPEPKVFGFGECGRPGCRAVSGKVNTGFCRSCNEIYTKRQDELWNIALGRKV